MEKKVKLFYNFLIAIIVSLLVILPTYCFAESNVTLEWNYNNAFITGYKVYRSTQSGVYDPNNPTSTIEDPNVTIITHYEIPDGTYYWIVTAYREHIPAEGLPIQYEESDFSNEVTATLLTSPVPAPTDNTISIIVTVNVNQ
ncbi:MAG: hypothetical protein ACFE9S_07435 [Candidatus Hermodarchaeota archaeon]